MYFVVVNSPIKKKKLLFISFAATMTGNRFSFSAFDISVAKTFIFEAYRYSVNKTAILEEEQFVKYENYIKYVKYVKYWPKGR